MQVYGYLEKAQLENVAADLPNNLAGLIWFNTVEGFAKINDGSAIRTVADLNSVQLFDNKSFSFFDSVAQVTPANPSVGNVRIYSKNDNQLYKLDSDGNESLIGSGGSSYKTRQWEDLESAVAADLFPTLSANVAVADDTVTFIDGERSAKLTQTSAVDSNFYETRTFDVADPIFKIGKIAFKFDFNSNAIVDSYTVETIANDGTDRVLLTTIIDKTGLGKFVSEIELEAADTSVKFKIYTTIPNDANELIVDNVRLDIEGENKITTYESTEWVKYIPQFNGFGTPTNIDVKWRREGTDFVFMGSFTTGTVTSSEARVYLPTGLEMSDILSASSSTNERIGEWSRSVASAQNHTALGTAGYPYIRVGRDDQGALTVGGGNRASGSNEHVSFFGRVPIQGWTSYTDHVVTSTSLEGTDIVVEGAGNGGQALSSNVDIPFIASTDSNSAWSGTQFTVPLGESGVYTFDGTANFNASLSGQIRIAFGGVTSYQISSDSTNPTHPFSHTKYLEEGTVVSIRATFSGTLTNSANHVLSITKAAAVTKTDILNMMTKVESQDVIVEAGDNFGQGVGANVAVPFNTEIQDTNNAWDGDEFTSPETAVFTIAGAFYATTSVSRAIHLYKDGVYHKRIGASSLSTMPFSWTGQLIKDSVYSVRSNVSLTLVSGSTANHNISITKAAAITEANVLDVVNTAAKGWDHTTAEVETGNTFDGQKEYARTFTVVGDQTSTFTLASIGTGLTITNGIKRSGIFNLNQYSFTLGATQAIYCYYDPTVGDLAFSINTQTLSDGAIITVKYLK